MKPILKIFSLFLIFNCALPFLSTAQEKESLEITAEVNRVYPPVSITKEKLKNAESLLDINSRYEADWVREYVIVEISASIDGKMKKTIASNDILTTEQMDLINKADLGTDILVRVEYIPENNLSIKDIKEMDFSFIIDPENDAQFEGGEAELTKYLKVNALDKVSLKHFKEYQLAAYKFTINEKGQIIEPSVFWSSDDAKTDELLISAICNMPTWKPAEHADGTRVSQEFVLSVGDMRSCVVNLLHINQE